MEQVKTTIKRAYSGQNLKAKRASIVGQYIKCSACGEIDDQETCLVTLEDNRYKTRCVRCGMELYLCMQHIK